MTNELAMQILREMIPKFARCDTDVKKRTAINLAIKALDEQSQPESTIATGMMAERQDAVAEIDKLVQERKRVLSYEICKKTKELGKLIHQWSTLFPDEIMPSDYYRKEIGQYDILNEMDV